MEKLILIIVVSLGLAACAASSKQQNVSNLKEVALQQYIQDEKLQAVNKVTMFDLRGWSSIDSKHLLLAHRNNQYLLVELKSRCYELDFVLGLGINRVSSSSLSAKFDSVFAPKRPEMKCYIDKIYVLDKAQKVKLRSQLDKIDSIVDEPEV